MHPWLIVLLIWIYTGVAAAAVALWWAKKRP